MEILKRSQKLFGRSILVLGGFRKASHLSGIGPHFQNGKNFTFSTTLCDIDFLGEVAGVGSYPEVFPNSVLVAMDGFEVRILTIEALIRAKETAGRAKDVAGLQELHALREAQSSDEK